VVILALVCVCLVPAAAWAARGIAAWVPRATAARLPRAIATRLPRGTAARVLAALPVVFVGAAPALAWLLHGAAEHAYASQVDYTTALQQVHVYSHAYFGLHGARAPAGPPVTAAPYAFAYQAAHALQDGLAGQAAGLPVAFAAILWGSRGSRGSGPEPAGS
jgi:hypothetical protein